MAQKPKRLLTPQARKKCQDIAEEDKGLRGKRVAALLAIDGGMSHSEAAREVGISLGQVKYALTLYRAKKMAAFSEETTKQAVAEGVSTPQKQPLTTKEEKPMAKAKKTKKKDEKKKKKEKLEKKLKKAKKAESTKDKGKKKNKAKESKKAKKADKKKKKKAKAKKK